MSKGNLSVRGENLYIIFNLPPAVLKVSFEDHSHLDQSSTRVCGHAVTVHNMDVTPPVSFELLIVENKIGRHALVKTLILLSLIHT